MEQSPLNLSYLERQVVLLVHQFFQEKNYKETTHKLEQESGVFFDMNHFETLLLNGKWDEAEKYLSGFTKVHDNGFSTRIYLEIRIQKYLEALDMKDHSKALEILLKDLKFLKKVSELMLKDLTQLLTLENFRENKYFCTYGNANSARVVMFTNIKNQIMLNPLLRNKLQFPTINKSRLHTLLNQSLNWQHQRCGNSKTDHPVLETLLQDHTCSSLTNTLMPGGFSQLGVHQSYQQAPLNPSPLSHAAVPWGSCSILNADASLLAQSGSPTADNQLAHSEHLMERSWPTGISDKNLDGQSLGDVKLRTTENSLEQSKIWNLTEINEPSQCRSLWLPDNSLATKVSRLIYTNSGLALLALTSNAVHKFWKWKKNDINVTERATASFSPQLWQPSSDILMTNELNVANPEAAVSCFALSKNDLFLVSTSGGKMTLFHMNMFKKMTTFMDPPPAATSLAFHPQDNNIVAIGMEDSSIIIYNVQLLEIIAKLSGHVERITGLAFSTEQNLLVSAGTNAQVCVWSLDGWTKEDSILLQIPRGQVPGGETLVQFNQHDQRYFLAVHETHLALYEAPKLECIKQWVRGESDPPITHATYSGDCQWIYSSFMDGSVRIFTAATLQFRCRINPTAYLGSNPSLRVYPVVIAANPSVPEQFALGLSDGSVHVLEPLESEGNGEPPPKRKKCWGWF